MSSSSSAAACSSSSVALASSSTKLASVTFFSRRLLHASICISNSFNFCFKTPTIAAVADISAIIAAAWSNILSKILFIFTNAFDNFVSKLTGTPTPGGTEVGMGMEVIIFIIFFKIFAAVNNFFAIFSSIFNLFSKLVRTFSKLFLVLIIILSCDCGGHCTSNFLINLIICPRIWTTICALRFPTKLATVPAIPAETPFVVLNFASTSLVFCFNFFALSDSCCFLARAFSFSSLTLAAFCCANLSLVLFCSCFSASVLSAFTLPTFAFSSSVYCLIADNQTFTEIVALYAFFSVLPGNISDLFVVMTTSPISAVSPPCFFIALSIAFDVANLLASSRFGETPTPLPTTSTLPCGRVDLVLSASPFSKAALLSFLASNINNACSFSCCVKFATTSTENSAAYSTLKWFLFTPFCILKTFVLISRCSTIVSCAADVLICASSIAIFFAKCFAME